MAVAMTGRARGSGVGSSPPAGLPAEERRQGRDGLPSPQPAGAAGWVSPSPSQACMWVPACLGGAEPTRGAGTAYPTLPRGWLGRGRECRGLLTPSLCLSNPNFSPAGI